MRLPMRAPIRIARPTGDLAAAERFWVDGVGLEVLWRTGPHPADGTTSAGHELLMVGPKDAGWHLEIVADPESAAAAVTFARRAAVTRPASRPAASAAAAAREEPR